MAGPLAPFEVNAQAELKLTAKRIAPKDCAVKFKKTMLCRYFPKCTRGDACLYAHSQTELKPRPNFTKTRLCAGYADGRCKLQSSQCPFAHGHEELRSPHDSAQPKAPAAVDKQVLLKMKSVTTDLETMTPTNSGSSTPISLEDAFGSGCSTPPFSQMPSSLVPPPPGLSKFDYSPAFEADTIGRSKLLGVNYLGLAEELVVLGRWSV